MGLRRLLVAAAAVAAPAAALVAFAGGVALAQSKPARAPVTNRAASHAPAPKRAPADAGGGPSSGALAPAAAATVVGASASAPSDAGVAEARTLDGGTRVFKFSELDIEGRLKSPQLVYFLRRVRAEFAAEDLGHRSFMREMSETRKEPSF
ncbi:MAG TPA: hypothetical protein VHV30_14415 [Polyangiaceae bacterium]|jgi:hypothetical protein|nr:hypothetical protein [Polyangiaceae bacterium]